MKNALLLLFATVCGGCHAHLGKQFGWAHRAAFGAQIVNRADPGPIGLDTKESEGAMDRQRAYGFPEDSGGAKKDSALTLGAAH